MMWSSGDPVAWRSVKDGAVRTAMPLVVVRDEPDLTALYRPVGTIDKRRTGERGGPGGRLMLRWDGGHEDATWSRNRVLVLYKPGAAHTVQLFWDETGSRAALGAAVWACVGIVASRCVVALAGLTGYVARCHLKAPIRDGGRRHGGVDPLIRRCPQWDGGSAR